MPSLAYIACIREGVSNEEKGARVLGRRYSLSGWELLFVFAALALLAVLNVAQLLPQRDAAADAVSTDSALRDRPMTGDMLWNYQRWDRRDRAVAVFARGKTAFGWVDGYLDETVARTDALTWCRQHGADCEVIEVRADLARIEGVDVPLTDRLVPIMARARATSGPTALAVSGTGAYGIGRGQTPDEAAATARAVCTSAAATDRPGFLPTHPCKVIYQR